MLSIYKYEMKASLKQLLIWALSVGGMGFFCIILYNSIEGNITDMAKSFSDMGALSQIFGMDKLSLATVRGYFATEIGTIHSLGSAMFSAAMATVILSKEEDGHTAEFTFTLPVSRIKIIAMKYLAVLSNLVSFAIICMVLYQISFVFIGADNMGSDFYRFMFLQFMMNVEIASICFVISACSRKNKLGIGIAVAMILYFFDMIARVIPDLKDYSILTPLSYSNASDIFTNASEINSALIFGICITVILTIVSSIIYAKRDLAS